MIAYLRQRWADFKREWRIHSLLERAVCAKFNGCPHLSESYFTEMDKEIAQRSPQQVARMARNA